MSQEWGSDESLFHVEEDVNTTIEYEAYEETIYYTIRAQPWDVLIEDQTWEMPVHWIVTSYVSEAHYLK